MIESLHMQELLHNIAQGLLYPTMAILIVLLVYAIWCIGSLCVEGLVERRHFRVAMPELLARIDDASYDGLYAVIDASGLLGYQKRELETLVAYGYLPEESRVALAKRMLSEQEDAYTKVASRTDIVAKIAPMIGLMGTLIPLGPGVVALGQGQTELLSSSIEIAFDTTIAGLTVAIVSMIVSRFRKRWYEGYLTAMESIMDAILEKAHDCLEAGENLGDSGTAAKRVAEIEAKHPAKGHSKRRDRKGTGQSASTMAQPGASDPLARYGIDPALEGGA